MVILDFKQGFSYRRILDMISKRKEHICPKCKSPWCEYTCNLDWDVVKIECMDCHNKWRIKWKDKGKVLPDYDYEKDKLNTWGF